MKTLKMVAAVALLATVTMAQASKGAQTQDILSTVQTHKALNLLVAALHTGSLAETLRGDGTFTVIAPTDRAFASLPVGDMQKLMANAAAMHILLVHYVLRGNIASSDAASLSAARTLMGAKLHTDAHNGELRVNGAKIVEGDIRCTNGVIHVVDTFDPGLVHEALAIATPNHH